MAHKLKIELQHSEPKIYRTVIVPEHFTFDELHTVIQCVMNWDNSHLYQFNLGAAYRGVTIAIPDEENDFGFLFGQKFETLDSSKEVISTYFNGKNKKVTYIYDFGDDWIHIISVQKKPSEEVLRPQCIKGENAAPIEDIGGMYGFYELLEIIDKKRKTSGDKDWLECYGISRGKSYDQLFGFDLDEVNEVLGECFG
jgi:hypothetical protein